MLTQRPCVVQTSKPKALAKVGAMLRSIPIQLVCPVDHPDMVLEEVTMTDSTD